MTRTEQKLHVGAERWWPGSGDDLVAVYRALSSRDSLWAAAMISALLQDATRRAGCLAVLRQRLRRPARRGPTMSRYEAAVAALDRLEARR